MKMMAVSIGTVVSLVLILEAGSVDNFNDPEPEVTWTPPAREEEFQEFGYGAKYSGLLFAGTIEFDWIVDIRTEDEDQESWAVGNVVTYKHVLTTCRAVDFLQSHSVFNEEEKLEEPTNNWTVDKYENRQSKMKIHYCRNYLWAADSPYGVRYADEIVRHPSCSLDKMSFDTAFIVVFGSIPALEPDIGYMPIGFNYRTDRTQNWVNLKSNEKITHKSPVCYVASFGKNYYNHKEFYVLDFKIKFRVYVTPWKDCRDTWDYICNEKSIEQCRDPHEKDTGGGYLMCFRPRAKVGTVCDHDRGAPLVCDGKVAGLVVRGVKRHHCNSLYKIPFIVERLDHYWQFFEKSVDYVVRPVPRIEDTTKAPSHHIAFDGAAAHQVILPLYTAALALICTYVDQTEDFSREFIYPLKRG